MLERDLYTAFVRWLAGPDFDPLKGKRFYRKYSRAFDTSELNWSSDSGDWMRPDATFIQAMRLKYQPSATLDVHTIEVKTGLSSLTPAVHQALSYSRISDFCYLASPETRYWDENLCRTAKTFGVGLISINAENPNLNRIVLEAQRNQPDTSLKDLFVDKVITDVTDQKAFWDVFWEKM